MIAGLPKAPSRDNPISNPDAAKERRNHVLGRMVEAGYIDDTTYGSAIQAPITAKPHGLRSELDAPYVAEMVRTAMVAEFGDEAYTRGINVYTTVDSKLQEAANKAVQKGLHDYTKRHGYRRPTTNLGYPSDLQEWQAVLQKQPIVDGTQAAAIVSVHQHSVSAMLADGELVTIPWSGLSWARPFQDKKYPGPAPSMAGQVVTLGDVVRVYQKENGNWSLTQLPKAQAALISMDANNGAIKALVGGFNYRLSHFNRATQAERQPGSIFKPFIYSAALAKGLTLATTINDAPVVIKNTTTNELWRPHNDNLTFYGPTRLAVGLMKSRNLVSIRLLQLIGIPYTLNYVERFGFASDALPSTLSLALGSGIVTPMQVTTGFATFANGGFSVKPYFIEHIEDENGINLYQANPMTVCHDNCTEGTPVATPVITAQNAYLMRHALENVVRFGTGRRARELNRDDIAGKTGTTNDQVDAWFAGFNSDLVTTVWVGYDQPMSLHEYGSQVALPIWIDFMKVGLAGKPVKHRLQPDGIITARIDPATGLLARPGQKNAIFELFREEYVPTNAAPFEQHAAIPLGDDQHSEEAVIPEQLF